MAEKLNLHKLAFIGGGAMGEAIIKGITGAGLMDPAAIFVGAHRQERADYLHETYGVTGLVDNCEAVKDADMVVFGNQTADGGQCAARRAGFRCSCKSSHPFHHGFCDD